MVSFSLMALSPTLSPSKCFCPKKFLDGECSLSSASVSSLVVLYHGLRSWWRLSPQVSFWMPGSEMWTWLLLFHLLIAGPKVPIICNKRTDHTD